MTMQKMPDPMVSLYLFPEEKQAILALEMEGRKLKAIVAKVWAMYMNSYSPKIYRRTGNTRMGMKLGSAKRKGVVGYELIITFEDDLMYHKSYLGSKNKRGHALMLISNGWEAKKLEKRIGKRINRFTHYTGFDFFGKVMQMYKNTKHKGISLRISWTGNQNYTKK